MNEETRFLRGYFPFSPDRSASPRLFSETEFVPPLKILSAKDFHNFYINSETRYRL